MVEPALRCVKGGDNIMRALLAFEKYEIPNYDVCVVRRYS